LGLLVRRVLIWTEAYWVGGCDRFLADLLGGLGDRPFEVRVAGIPLAEYDEWLSRKVPGLAPRETVRVASLPSSPLTRARLALRGSADGDGPPADLSAAGGDVPLPVSAAVAGLRYRHAVTNYVRLRRLLRRARPDVLFINNGGYPGGESCRYAAPAARAEGVPRVVHFVHNMAYPRNWPPEVEARIDAAVDDAVDVWVTAADRASRALEDLRGMSDVRTVHYGIPAAQAVSPASGIGFSGDALNVAVVANFEPRKGHAVLLDALVGLGGRVRCAFVGSGPEEERLRRRVAGEGLPVEFLGWRDDVPAILRASDALVLPSLANECLPYAILEAMSHGLPVVSTDVAGIPEEVVDGETGFVVAPGDARALGEALDALARDRDLAAHMGAAGRERARTEFSLERMVDQVTDLWAGGSILARNSAEARA
jgi:glycosyltransferase involved in cell wall biosynthesis